MVVVTDINQERLNSAASKCTVAAAKECGCDLRYINTSGMENAAKELIEMSNGGFDDVILMAPVPELFTLAGEICREDGCINMFAGPSDHNLQGKINIYRIHYDGIHLVGTTGSIPEDTSEVLRLIEAGDINPAVVVTHILGLNAVIDTLKAIATPGGGKKVCYTGLDIPLVAIDEFAELGRTEPMYKKLAEIVNKNGGLWCEEAEKYLLAHAPEISMR